MTRLFLMNEHARPPAIPAARRSGGPAGPDGSPGPVRTRRGWDIPWLGGRSSAPWVVLAAVVILLLATIGTIVAARRPDRLGWTVKTIVVQNDSSLRFTFDVFKAPRAQASCDIVAADINGGVGILRDVVVPARADGDQNTELSVTVPTSRRATTADIDNCRIISTG